MMKGMKGGVVCASPPVSSTAKAYSFHEKIKQMTAVAALPVTACGDTTMRNGLHARVAVDPGGLLVFPRNYVDVRTRGGAGYL